MNDAKPDWVINKVKIAISDLFQDNPDKTSKEVVVACYRLAFEPDIDDLRESSAIVITQKIVEMYSGCV
ncbi:hypothetical protein NLG07_07790 [Alteromonas sp. LMIT006]|uniref:hypothetical protein n=1 Tax=Alteromonadaceae TaxID=72275 RepID=UPI0020CA5121|nr:hypothetical protein [Alteromonas sp. LMIT006]UTP71912.1 hypothetical protein NLG07_07790 [Alteromonas sp. LMIT006]